MKGIGGRVMRGKGTGETVWGKGLRGRGKGFSGRGKRFRGKGTGKRAEGKGLRHIKKGAASEPFPLSKERCAQTLFSYGKHLRKGLGGAS